MNACFAPRRILVTGAGGFVGAQLCATLAEHGMQVVAARRRTPQTQLAGVRSMPLELLVDESAWRAALRACDAVVHLAASVHDVSGQTSEAEFRRVNVDGSRFVAERAIEEGVGRFIFLSSIKVNGEGRDEPYRDTDAPDPQDAYGRSKWAAELLLSEICAVGGMRCIRVRPPLVYGPGVKANFRRLLRLADSPIPLPLGSIHNSRSLIGILNLVSFIETCLSHPRACDERPWLISDGEDVSTPELIARMRKLLGRPGRMLGVPQRWMRRAASLASLSGVLERLAGTLRVDSSAARAALGWVPPYTLDQELARTVHAYRGSSAR
jgi:nucleoside-diphosphate-sugar epimerase